MRQAKSSRGIIRPPLSVLSAVLITVAAIVLTVILVVVLIIVLAVVLIIVLAVVLAAAVLLIAILLTVFVFVIAHSFTLLRFLAAIYFLRRRDALAVRQGYYLLKPRFLYISGKTACCPVP